MMLYVLGDDAGWQKIGVSGWGVSRVRSVASPNGAARYAIAQTQTSDKAYRIEKLAHGKLKDKRRKSQRNSEWFLCSGEEAMEAVKAAWDAVETGPIEWKMACGPCGGFGKAGDRNCPCCFGLGLANTDARIGLERHAATSNARKARKK